MLAKESWNRAVLNTALAGALVLAAGSVRLLVAGQRIQQTDDPTNARLTKFDSSPATTDAKNKPDAEPNEGAAHESDAADIDEKPLSVAIVIETSSRVEPLLPAIRHTGILLTQEILGPDGEAAVIGYNDQVNRLLDFTSDNDAIEKTVKDIKAGTSGTHLYDALSQAEALLSDRPSSRRHVIVVLGEAADHGSEEKLGQVIHEAQQDNVTIYAVGLSFTDAQLRGPDEQAAPPPMTPPGIFSLPPTPGTPQTPTTEALRDGNINLGALAALGYKHTTAATRDNPFKIATAATGGLYQPTFRERSIEPAIDEIAAKLHAD